MSEDIREHLEAINNLVSAIEDLQASGVGVEIEQLEDGRFDVGATLDNADIQINASFPKQTVRAQS